MSVSVSRVTKILGGLFVLLTVSACSSGPQLVKESEMQNKSKVASIAKKNVITRMNRDPHITSVALVGVNSTRGTHGSNKNGARIDPTRISGIIDRVNDVKNANDMAKLTSCRALEAAF